MWYELWDVETSNRVGTYPNEEEALLAVRDGIERYGRYSGPVASLGLVRRDPSGKNDRLIAKGFELAERALALDRTIEHAEHPTANPEERTRPPIRRPS